MSSINWLAVLLATLSGFITGWLWYSPLLFANAWMKVNNFTEATLKKGNPLRIYGISGLLFFVMAVNLSMFLANTPGLKFLSGLLYGALSGLWVFCGVVIIALFERRPAQYMLINGGYGILSLAVMGGIVGAMQ